MNQYNQTTHAAFTKQNGYVELDATPWQEFGELAIKKLNNLHRGLPVVLGGYDELSKSLQALGVDAKQFFKWLLLEVTAYADPNGGVIIRENTSYPQMTMGWVPGASLNHPMPSLGYVRITNKEGHFSICCECDTSDRHGSQPVYNQYNPSTKMYMLIGILLSATAQANKFATAQAPAPAPVQLPNQPADPVDRIVSKLSEHVNWVKFTKKGIEIATGNVSKNDLIEFADWLCDDSNIECVCNPDRIEMMRVHFDKRLGIPPISAGIPGVTYSWMDITFTDVYSGPSCSISGPLKKEWVILKAIVAQIFGPSKQVSHVKPTFPPNTIRDEAYPQNVRPAFSTY